MTAKLVVKAPTPSLTGASANCLLFDNLSTLPVIANNKLPVILVNQR